MRTLGFIIGLALLGCGDGKQSQAPECQKWIQCEASFAPNTAGIDNARFGPGEACWNDKDSADLCKAECIRQLANAKASSQPAAACQ